MYSRHGASAHEAGAELVGLAELEADALGRRAQRAFETPGGTQREHAASSVRPAALALRELAQRCADASPSPLDALLARAVREPGRKPHRLVDDREILGVVDQAAAVSTSL